MFRTWQHRTQCFCFEKLSPTHSHNRPFRPVHYLSRSFSQHQRARSFRSSTVFVCFFCVPVCFPFIFFCFCFSLQFADRTPTDIHTHICTYSFYIHMYMYQRTKNIRPGGLSLSAFRYIYKGCIYACIYVYTVQQCAWVLRNSISCASFLFAGWKGVWWWAGLTRGWCYL